MNATQRAVALQAHYIAIYERGEKGWRERHGDPFDLLYREGKISARECAKAKSTRLKDTP